MLAGINMSRENDLFFSNISRTKLFYDRVRLILFNITLFSDRDLFLFDYSDGGWKVREKVNFRCRTLS